MKAKQILMMVLLTGISFSISAQDASFYRRDAVKGDKTAMYFMGNFYLYGTGGLQQDYNQAVMWLTKSANKKYAPAQVLLASCYIWGTGVLVDYGKACKLIQKAVKQNYAEAHYLLAYMYKDGIYYHQNDTYYLKYLQSAAELGDPDAQAELGDLYMFGSTSPYFSKDVGEALSLYQKAASQNNGAALLQLGFIYRDGLEGYVAEDSELGFQYIQAAARTGLARAQCEYGIANLYGLGCEVNYSEAAVSVFAAAQQEDSKAYMYMGILCQYGWGREQNELEAVGWYQKAVDAGYDGACSRLAWMYLSGNGVERDDAKALQLYKQAADAGYASGYSGLGSCYEYGNDAVDKNVSTALAYYKKAVEIDDDYARYHLYRIYINGNDGIEKDVVEALRYLREAADNGYDDALYSLGYEYWTGEHLHMELANALKYITQAADGGYSYASAVLGTLYYDGVYLVTNKNYDKAFHYLDESTHDVSSIPDALMAQVYRDLGACHRYGRGTKVDHGKASYYTELAAKYGDTDSFDVVRILREK